MRAFNIRYSPQLLRLECRDVPTAGYFRIANYNIASSDVAPAAGLATILEAIGVEPANGRSEAIDLIALQEVASQATTSQAVVNMLNGLYGSGIYNRGSLNGASTGSGTQGIVYNQQTLQLLSETAVGTASVSGQPRQAMRYKMHPVGYASSADFYIYVSHFKADTDQVSLNRRQAEAAAIRANADALGQATTILYVGDLNVYDSAETFYQTLLSPGNGQAFDPINRIGAWHNNASFRDILTQAPAVNPPNGLTGGGLDDRFDQILVSGELTDGVGLDYIVGTYHTFGNNGSVALNGNINDATSTALPGLANRTTVLNLLTTVTDHLPVVADFRVIPPPAVASIQIGDGTAQRSRLSQVKVVFDQVVSFTGQPAAAFRIDKIVGGNPAGTVSFSVSSATVGGRTEATLTFTSDTSFGSLVDGRYRLTVLASQVTAGGQNLATDSVTNFHRLFGDANGDARIDVADFGFFSSTYLLSSGQAGFLSYFDSNNDGRIDITDFGQFSVRYFTTLP